MIEAVILRNKGRTTFSDQWDGVTYTISPGKMKAVPVAAAKHWLGDWELEGSSLRADVRRAADRKGRLPNLEIVTDNEDPEEKAPSKSDKKGQD